MSRSVEHVLKVSPPHWKIGFCICGAQILKDLSSSHLALGSLATADVNYELARHNADNPTVKVQYAKLYRKDLLSFQSLLEGTLTHARLFIILFSFVIRHSFFLWLCPVFCDLMISVN